MSQLIEFKGSTESVFGQLANGINVEEYISLFKADKSDMVNNYKALRRCSHKMLARSSLHLYSHDTDSMPSVVRLKKANKRLESAHWKNILDSKELFTLMSYKEKKKWNDIFDKLEVPEFNEDNVILSIRDILGASSRYFAERICFALESLSKDHVTNSQFGFGEKIIIKGVHSGMTASNPYPSLAESKYSAFEEIRKIVSFLSTGNLEMLKDHMDTYGVLDKCVDMLRDEGKSEFTLDAGNIHIKVFKVGTIHLFIKPEIAEKMNNFVSIIYKNKLPSTLKKKSYFKGEMKKQILQSDPVSRKVIMALSKLNYLDPREVRSEKIDGENVHWLPVHVEKELCQAGLMMEFNRVVKTIGGCAIDQNRYYSFPYGNIKKVVDEITISGALDNQVAYQQFYTKDNLAKDAYDMMTDLYSNAELMNMDFLEPSCGGLNGLLSKLPKSRAKGIDVSRINVAMRKSQGYDVVCKDFVDYAKKTTSRFDMILSNPPFRNSQAYNHVMLSFDLLKEKGVLTAILPVGLRDEFDFMSEQNNDIEITKSGNYEKAFDDTDWSVFILRITKG